MHWQHRRRASYGCRAGLLFIVVLLAPTFGAGVARADEGARNEGTTTYVVDAESGVVHTSLDLRITNELQDERDGNVIRRPYFQNFTIPVPSDAVNIVATGDGTPLTVTVTPAEGNAYAMAQIDFASNLFSGESMQLHVTFDLVGNAPRSDSPSRINAVYASFVARGSGDPGLSTIRIVIPDEYEVESFGEEVVTSKEDGNQVLTAAGISNPEEWYVLVSARNDAALESSSGKSGGVRFDVQAWPNDDAWSLFVHDTVTSGVPVLEDLIGSSWPLDRTVNVRETSTPYFYGYAGWFDARTGEIEIGEQLDKQVVLHELSHAWFNHELFTDRWISEGLAQEYASQAVTRLGAPRSDPKRVDKGAPGYTPLADWERPPLGEEEARDFERYGYNASWFVLDAIADEIGKKRMARVLAAADDRTIAYVGDDDPEHLAVESDWRHFLDLAEQVGGATVADDVLRRFVVPGDEAGRLDERATARASYNSLEEAGGDWAPPLGIRVAMSNWHFDDAQGWIEEATGVLATRDELAARARALGLVPPADTEAPYEAADDHLTKGLQDIDDTLEARLDALEQIADVEDVKDDAVARFVELGLQTDLDTFVAPARDAFEAGDVDRVGESTKVATDEIAAWVDASEKLHAAREAEADDRGFFQCIGLRGTDLDGDLEAAAQAFAAGDRAAVVKAAADVQATLDDAESVGKSRVTVAAGVSLAALLVIILATALIIRRKRRRRRSAGTSDEQPPNASVSEPASAVR